MSDNLKEFITTDSVAQYINRWDDHCTLLAGPMNTGKTAATAIKTMIYCYNRAPVIDNIRQSRFLVARHDYQAIEKTILNEMLKWFPKGEFKIKHQPLMAIAQRPPQMKNGAMQYGVHAEFTPVSMKNIAEFDLRSLNETGLVTVETQEMTYKVLMELYDRTGRFPYQYGPRLWFGDLNYPDDSHWLYEKFILEKKQAEAGKWTLIRQPPIFFETEDGYKENPDADIPSIREKPKYDYWSEIIRRNDKAEITQKVIGDFAMVPDGTPVYLDQWDDKYIEEVEPIENGTLLFGLDPGTVFGMLVGQVSNDGTLLILAELAPSANSVITDVIRQELWPLMNAEIVPHVIGKKDKIKTYGWRDQSDKMDSHSGMDTGELIKEEFHINTVKCGTKYPEHLLRVSRSVMMNGKVKIHPRCKKLIAACRGKWCIDDEGKPDKGPSSHIGNTFCYLCWGVKYDNAFVYINDDVYINVRQ